MNTMRKTGSPMIPCRTFAAIAGIAWVVPAWAQIAVPAAPAAPPIRAVQAVPALPAEPFRYSFDSLTDINNEVRLLAQNAAFQLQSTYAKGGSDDGLYQNGQSALESRRWDQALVSFSQVVSRGGPRADGATYWKAYTLNKLGRRDEALAAIADLRKNYASSRWL